MEEIIQSLRNDLPWLVTITLFLVGTTLGSYAITYWSRYKAGMKNIFDVNKKDKCFCFNCKTKLKLVDMIPIFSYFFHRGKCHYCKCSIGISTLFCELSCGLIGIAIGLLFF